VKPHIEVREIKNIIYKALGDNYKLESIWKVIEIPVMNLASFCINKPTIKEVSSDLKEAIEMETNMQSPYDVSHVSM
jgi:hypothetical protein